VSSALDLILQIERLDDGTRHITLITEVQRMEGDTITLQNLFEYHVDEVTPERKVIGSLRPTGLRPTFLPKFERHGLSVPEGLFGTPETAMFGAKGAAGFGDYGEDQWAAGGVRQ
jgi:pilus assembly protein CpaF